MPRNFKIARQKKNLKVNDAAAKLGVSQPALSSWESERKSPTLDNLEKMAALYGVSTDYLLGIVDNDSSSTVLTQENLKVLNGKPVWSSVYGWMLVNNTAEYLISTYRELIPFDCAGKLSHTAPRFAEGTIPMSAPLSRSEIFCQTQVWVEPISSDSVLREELRGWYEVKNRFVQNESGARFSFGSYGAKWLAFKT